jgi:hypothetical protein
MKQERGQRVALISCGTPLNTCMIRLAAKKLMEVDPRYEGRSRGKGKKYKDWERR